MEHKCGGQIAAVWLGVLLLCAGCGEKTSQLNSEQSKAFAGATPEVKQAWEKALAADKAGNFEAAVTAMDSLKTMSLSELQVQALEAERFAFGERLMAAVNKNDPAALAVLKKISNKKNR